MHLCLIPFVASLEYQQGLSLFSKSIHCNCVPPGVLLFLSGLHLIGASEANPLSSGWCETGSFGMSHLHNSLPYMVRT